MYVTDEYITLMFSKLLDAFGAQILILIVFYFLVLIMIFLDLLSGIRKAKRAGQFRTSKGLRRTGDKIAKYFNVLMLMTVIDCMQMVFFYYLNHESSMRIPIVPIATFLVSVFYGIVELRSIYENQDEKQKEDYHEAAKIITAILSSKNGKETIENLSNYLSNQNQENNAEI